jgi:hypothetical protein
VAGPVDMGSDLEEFRPRVVEGVVCCRANEFFLLMEPVVETFLVLAGGLIG